MKESDWYVYMIATDDGKLYTGITTDIERRWQEHNGRKPGGAKFFRTRKPGTLVYLENARDRSTASKREAFIKQLPPAEKRKLVATLQRAEKVQLEHIVARLKDQEHLQSCSD